MQLLSLAGFVQVLDSCRCWIGAYFGGWGVLILGMRGAHLGGMKSAHFGECGLLIWWNEEVLICASGECSLWE